MLLYPNAFGKERAINCHDADGDVAQYRRLGPEGALRVSVQSEICVKEVSYSCASLILSSDYLLLLVATGLPFSLAQLNFISKTVFFF